VVGLEQLAEASRRCRAAGVPLLAIGGLSLDNAASVAPWAELGAVISALLPAAGLAGVSARASALHAALLHAAVRGGEA
jgi:thiamine-phosphate pyrophosphorylase